MNDAILEKVNEHIHTAKVNINGLINELKKLSSVEKMSVSWNISPPPDSKVFHWFEWFRSRTNRGQRLKTLPRHYRYLEYKALTVHLCTYKKAQPETNHCNQNMIY